MEACRFYETKTDSGFQMRDYLEFRKPLSSNEKQHYEFV